MAVNAHRLAFSVLSSSRTNTTRGMRVVEGSFSNTIHTSNKLFFSTNQEGGGSNKPKYPHFEIRQTRFQDNDMFGHVNNSMYYQLMDDAINVHLIHRGIGAQYPRFIVENGIQFFKPISFPNNIAVGIEVTKLSTKAATYDVGFYEVVPGMMMNDTNDDDGNKKEEDEEEDQQPVLAARGKFVHCYVDLKTGRPVEIPQQAREVLETLVAKEE